MDCIYLTPEQVETIAALVNDGAHSGVQITGDAAQRTPVQLVAVRNRGGFEDNDYATVHPGGSTTGWER